MLSRTCTLSAVTVEVARCPPGASHPHARVLFGVFTMCVWVRLTLRRLPVGGKTLHALVVPTLFHLVWTPLEQIWTEFGQMCVCVCVSAGFDQIWTSPGQFKPKYVRLRSS